MRTFYLDKREKVKLENLEVVPYRTVFFKSVIVLRYPFPDLLIEVHFRHGLVERLFRD